MMESANTDRDAYLLGRKARDRRRRIAYVARKLESNATIFTPDEMDVVDEIARLAKHRYLLGETVFQRYEIRACGAQRREIE